MTVIECRELSAAAKHSVMNHKIDNGIKVIHVYNSTGNVCVFVCGGGCVSAKPFVTTGEKDVCFSYNCTCYSSSLKTDNTYDTP